VFTLEQCIEEAAEGLGGEHDGNEFGGGEAVLYTYGPDADALLTAIQRCLQGFPMRGVRDGSTSQSGSARSSTETGSSSITPASAPGLAK
jgi:hypothetical protein